MLKRKALKELERWHTSGDTRALLVTGARQVGKTFLIRHYLERSFSNVVAFDLVEQPDLLAAFDAARNADELFMAISAYAGTRMVPNETVVFIDEIQMCSAAMTAIKYLIARREYRWVLSGSLLGVELRDVRSLPVGSLRIADMYPLDFEEFCWAMGVGEDVLAEVRSCFSEQREVLPLVHDRLMALFHQYLLIGGMPAAVAEFAKSSNMGEVTQIQKDILRLYRRDISQYAPESSKLTIRDIFDTVPSQLSSQSKRFNFAALAPRGTFERYREDFVWLADAGVVLPVTSVREPRHPLRLSEGRSSFKLFMADVGLLAAFSGLEVAKSVLSDSLGVNYGSIYENAVAQELHCAGHRLHYFRSKNVGELDFVIEAGGGAVLPVEVKSGKDYHRHSALNRVLSTENYAIERAVVLYEGNVMVKGPVLYAPPYMAMCL